MSSTETLLSNLAIDSIRASATNPRQHFDAESMADLKASIAASGIQVPLLVRVLRTVLDASREGKDDGLYELVAGERRLRVAKELGLAEVPCLVREMTNAEARECQIVENLQRAGVHPLEEAEAYRQMASGASRGVGPVPADDEDEEWEEDRMVSAPLTAEDIAKRVGKTTAYVAKRLKLLVLTAESKDLYVRGHLTEGHALLLARLTDADQARALRFMLNIDPKFDKRTIVEQVNRALGIKPNPEFDQSHDDSGGDDSQDESEFDVDDDEADDFAQADTATYGYNMQKPQRVQYMREGRRLIDATEAQFERWVKSNILLKLADVPWRLDDDTLTHAGACVDCPKRSGSNVALFGDLTVEEDVCLDPTCFAAKQDATMKRHKLAAKATGAAALLKISSKRDTAKLEELAVRHEPLMVGNNRCGTAIHVTKKTIRAGQWLAALVDSCKDAMQGLMVDGEDKGKLLTVCANQMCKVHKHQVDRPRTESASSNGGGRETWEERNMRERAEELARQQKQREYETSEWGVRSAVFVAIAKVVKPDHVEMLRDVLMTHFDENGPEAMFVRFLGIDFKTADQEWTTESNAQDALMLHIEKGSEAQLLLLAFARKHHAELEIGDFDCKGIDRAGLWKLAKAHGVDAVKIAKAIDPPAAKAVKQIPSGNDKQKKVAAKPAKKSLIDAAGKKRIADAMKKRWAERRKVAAKSAAKKVKA